jgi:hypothetical protein
MWPRELMTLIFGAAMLPRAALVQQASLRSHVRVVSIGDYRWTAAKMV